VIREGAYGPEGGGTAVAWGVSLSTGL